MIEKMDDCTCDGAGLVATTAINSYIRDLFDIISFVIIRSITL